MQAPPDMTLDIQGLIDSTPDGGTIDIPYGRYVFKEGLVIKGRKNIIFRCAPGTRILIEDTNAKVLSIVESYGIRIENAYLRHLKPLEEYVCHGGVISINSSQDVKVLNCELNGCGSIGVSGWKSGDVFVRNCFIHHNTFSALSFSNCKDIKVKSCVIEENGNLMNLHKVDDFQMEDNIIRNNGGYWGYHPDSADAQDEIAATQAPSFLLARKKSKFDICDHRKERTPTAIIAKVYKVNEIIIVNISLYLNQYYG